jgi:hypothetical protein
MGAESVFMAFSKAIECMIVNLSKGLVCSSNQDIKHVRVI